MRVRSTADRLVDRARELAEVADDNVSSTTAARRALDAYAAARTALAKAGRASEKERIVEKSSLARWVRRA